MKGYDLSRNFWNWAFDNPEIISPKHAAIYFFAVEHCNRLGGKEKFGFPSQMTMDAIGIKKHQTYIKYFNELVDFGFFKLIQKSKNQYSANIISLASAVPKKGKALDKAIIKHRAKQIETNGQSTGQSMDSIVKPINKEPIKQCLLSELKNSDFDNPLYFEITISFYELFKKNLLENNVSTSKIEKSKGIWIDSIRLLIEQDKYTIEDLRDVFKLLQKDDFWKQNILSTKKLREKFDKLLLKARINGENRKINKEGCTNEELAEIIGKHFAVDKTG